MKQVVNEPLSLDYCYDIVVDLMVVSVVLVAGMAAVDTVVVAAAAVVVDIVVADLHYMHPRKHLPLALAMLRLAHRLILQG